MAVAAGLVAGLAGSAIAADDAGGKNHAPRLQGSEPQNYLHLVASTKVRWGKEIRFVIIAADPDGDVLEYAADGLPGGARFTAELREFNWTPGRQDVGEHAVKFTVSDGHASDTRVARFTVVENRAPVLAMTESYQLTSGEHFNLRCQGSDEDGDTLTYEMRNLPAGGAFKHKASEQFMWEPSDGQIGTHVVTVEASDGIASTTQDLELKVKDEWDSKFLPGVYYSFYRPADHASYGAFHGVSLELVPMAWIRRNENRGPSHGRVTLKVDLLDSTQSGVAMVLVYSAGLDMSIERNPLRRFLIPYFGVDVGGIVQKQIGHRFESMPHAGVYLWASRNTFISISAGYMIVPSQLDALRGWRASAGLNLTLW